MMLYRRARAFLDEYGRLVCESSNDCRWVDKNNFEKLAGMHELVYNVILSVHRNEDKIFLPQGIVQWQRQ